MGVALSTLLYAALRIARVTGRAGRGPTLDQFLEALAIFNRMVDGFSAVRVNLFGLTIASYNLTASQQTYTLGAGGSGPYWLSPTRPSKIAKANLWITTSPTTVRRPIGIMEPPDWANVAVQNVTGPPLQMYPDYASPLMTLYMWPIPDKSYTFELFTWNTIPQASAISNLVQLPQGYQEAIVYQLARRIPGAQLSSEDLLIARRSLAVLQGRNAQSPRLVNDAAGLMPHRGSRADFNWATGEPTR